MTLEELWQLFPIFLTEHNDSWQRWYKEEEDRIKNFIPCNIKINHIGSTAIKNICAKPIIDILLEIPFNEDMDNIKKIIVENGYTCMNESSKRKSFYKGYTEDGFEEKVFHLHLRYFGDNNEIYFRDYMNNNNSLAKEYETLKLSLSKKYKYDRDGYTNAKSDFILKYTKKAKNENS